jgi:hypothetical protein
MMSETVSPVDSRPESREVSPQHNPPVVLLRVSSPQSPSAPPIFGELPIEEQNLPFLASDGDDGAACDDDNDDDDDDDITVHSAFMSRSEVLEKMEARHLIKSPPILSAQSIAEKIQDRREKSIAEIEVESSRIKTFIPIINLKNEKPLRKHHRSSSRVTNTKVLHPFVVKDVFKFIPPATCYGSWHNDSKLSTVGLVVDHTTIKAGQLVFSERPLLFCRTTDSPDAIFKSISLQVGKFTRQHKKSVAVMKTLYVSQDSSSQSGGISIINGGSSVEGATDSIATSAYGNAGAFELNVLKEHGIVYGSDTIGLFVYFSRLRHSCAPNIEARVSDQGVVTAYALREISPGEELTHNILGDVNVKVLDRHEMYKNCFPSSIGCHCFVCSSSNEEEELRRTAVMALTITSVGVKENSALVQLSAIENFIGLLEAPVSLPLSKLCYRNCKLLRELHAKASSLCLRVGHEYEGMRHLTIACAYYALGMGWTHPETLRLILMIEKRSLQPCPIVSLPIFRSSPYGESNWGTPRLIGKKTFFVNSYGGSAELLGSDSADELSLANSVKSGSVKSGTVGVRRPRRQQSGDIEEQVSVDSQFMGPNGFLSSIVSSTGSGSLDSYYKTYDSVGSNEISHLPPSMTENDDCDDRLSEDDDLTVDTADFYEVRPTSTGSSLRQGNSLVVSFPVIGERARTPKTPTKGHGRSSSKSPDELHRSGSKSPSHNHGLKLQKSKIFRKISTQSVAISR